MARRTVAAGTLLATAVACLVVTIGGSTLLAADPVTSPLQCTAALVAATPPAKPDAPPLDSVTTPPTPDPSTTATPSATTIARLYMPDGQLISHGLTVYVAADLHASQDLRLRLFRHHAITEVNAGEEKPLLPALVASGQQWVETFQGRQVYATGMLLIFDTSSMSFAGRAMTRVRPLLTWKDGGVEHCALGAGEVNVGDIIFATVWTATAVVVALLFVVVLALTKKDNPMGLLTGVDGHLALSQAQVACWTIFVGSVVLGYGLIRREIPDIPESLLVLMGASLATGGLAYYQDAKNARAAAAAGAPVLARSWTWSDLIRVFPAGQESELSLAKAQMLFWTVLLLVLFVSKSMLDGQIWAVPWAMVALMGFSQVGYLAPKVADAATPPPTTPAAGPTAENVSTLPQPPTVPPNQMPSTPPGEVPGPAGKNDSATLTPPADG